MGSLDENSSDLDFDFDFALSIKPSEVDVDSDTAIEAQGVTLNNVLRSESPLDKATWEKQERRASRQKVMLYTLNSCP